MTESSLPMLHHAKQRRSSSQALCEQIRAKIMFRSVEAILLPTPCIPILGYEQWSTHICSAASKIQTHTHGMIIANDVKQI